MKRTLFGLACGILSACAVLPLTYLLPDFDLNGVVALGAYYVAESGSKFVIPLIAIVMTGLIVSRRGVSGKRCLLEIVVIVGVLSLVMGGGAYLNEHVIKPRLAVARPNIRALAEAGVLNMTAEEFYALPDKPARSEHLRTLLTADGFDTVRLHPLIRDHWISESGFSFPSGHSLSAMLCATFFLGMGLSLVTGPRRLPFYLLVFWAVLICYSRPILRVHSATDVLLGGLEGVVLGVLSFILVRGVLAVADGNADTPVDPTSY